MESSALASRGTPVKTPEPAQDRQGIRVRALLRGGTFVGPFYLAVGILQGLLREGFEFRRHALSHLANGPGGWVQTANFLVSGSLVVGAAIAFARVLRGQSRMVGWWLGMFGTSMLVAAVFPADPVFGFPPGTPQGVPTSMSSAGLIHFAAGAIGFMSLAISCFVAARALSLRNERSMARRSVLAGVAVLVGFFGGGAFSSSSAGIAGIWFSVVVGWAWLTATSRHLERQLL